MTISWDGRIDNREELQTRLGVRHAEPGDAALAMCAYRRWGVDGLSRLVGDFAVALRDAGDHALHLARDCAGTRPLYYTVADGVVRWSRDLRELVATAALDDAVDDEFLAAFVGHGHLPGSTPYRGIRSVKPGHVVTIDAGGRVSERCFWTIDNAPEIRYRTDEEYEEHFLDLFRASVCGRLRSDGPVCAHLSGGLDSSGIVCVAADALRQANRPQSDLQTISYVFDDAVSADERTWIRAVEAHRGVEGWHISDRDAPFWEPHPDPLSFATPNRLLIASAFDREVRRRMAAIGSRVILSGHGGDHMLCSAPLPPPHLRGLLGRGRLLELHRELHGWALATRQPYVRLLWRNVLQRRSPHETCLPPWLTARFAERIRAVKPSNVSPFALAVAQVEMEARHEPPGIEVAYPYLDRRLVEFLAGIPYSQRVMPGEPRRLMRRALRGVLPEAVRLRRSKGNPTAFIAGGMSRKRTEILALLSDLRVGERGLVKPREFREAVERAMHGGETYSAALMLLLRIELWLRRVEGRGAAARVHQQRPIEQEVTDVTTV